MENWKGRPEISGADHPKTVYKALLGSAATWYAEKSMDEARDWVKRSQDAYGAIQDGFGLIDPDYDLLKPDGDARLYMSLDQLELALVGYGVDLLDNDPETATVEVANVDDLLTTLDTLK